MLSAEYSQFNYINWTVFTIILMYHVVSREKRTVTNIEDLYLATGKSTCIFGLWQGFCDDTCDLSSGQESVITSVSAP